MGSPGSRRLLLFIAFCPAATEQVMILILSFCLIFVLLITWCAQVGRNQMFSHKEGKMQLLSSGWLQHLIGSSQRILSNPVFAPKMQRH